MYSVDGVKWSNANEPTCASSLCSPGNPLLRPCHVPETPLEGRDYTVGDMGADIGTLEACDIRVARDPAMLPLHARITESADGYLLEAIDTDSPIIMENRMLARKLLRFSLSS